MKSILAILSEKVLSALTKSYPNFISSDFKPEIRHSTQTQFGHYACNVAMQLTKILQENPRVIAQKIIENFDKDQDNQTFVSKLEIAGPGFINITIDSGYLSHRLNKISEHPRLGFDLPDKPQNVVVDFSSPNVAKEMHVGHLRSTIIGDSICRLFEFLGHNVLRLNHIGDWGTAFGMLIAYIKNYQKDILEIPVKITLAELMQFYRASKAKFDEDPEFKLQAQKEVVALQSGNPESLKIWKLICDISEKAYQEIYDLLDIKFIYRGESFYNPLLAPVVLDLESKGLIQISDGAKCIFLDGFLTQEGTPLPVIVQKADGGYNYSTTDLAAIRHRVQVEHADRIIYVVDAGQSLHLQMIFLVAQKAGYYDPKNVLVEHVGFGLVLGPDGKKFKTRSGDTEKLIDLLTAAIAQAYEILVERDLELPESEREKLSHTLGIAAVKYADLSINRISDYAFNYDKMLKFEGNTPVFLIYTYVRAQSILRKAQTDISPARIEISHPSEIALALHVAQFQEVIDAFTVDLLPHRLCEYLFVLAEKFNAFFRDCKVVGSPEQDSRLAICDVFARTMKQGLELLGIQTVQKM